MKVGLESCAMDDDVFRERMRGIIVERGITVVVETGIGKGWSTIALSKMASLVFGIDNDFYYLQEANKNIQERCCNNVILMAGCSPDVLAVLKPALPDSTLYFLDAHWQRYWPLRDEIKAIRPGAGIIVMHDFEVPGHPELGFDQYPMVNGWQALNYEYVRKSLTAWSLTHRVEYNERSEGTEFPRGVAYVFPR